ncbi:hypothetical protein [Telmatospirillum sp. J64-1]|uniref:capsular polysaccharide export protein, LipB/KpsS family n=1 Tax=Telmatospirillum sp. J64-1 TaxID=2502183 RepID=UPI001C8F7E98|nr:hypothetical protein [Telmatospirillum sp. J64-1]
MEAWAKTNKEVFSSAFSLLSNAKLAAEAGDAFLAKKSQREAMAAPGRYADYRHGLPEKTSLIYLPWHQALLCQIKQAQHRSGRYAVLVSGMDDDIAGPDFSLGPDFREIRYQGINLWGVSAYSICTAAEKCPTDINAEEDKEHIGSFFRRAARLIIIYNRYLDFYDPDGILTTQGYILHSAVLNALAAQRGVKTVTLENTLVRDRLVWDDFTGIAVNSDLPRRFFLRYGDLINDKEACEFADAYLSSLKAMKQQEHITPQQHLPEGEDPRPYLLYLGQVYSDASVLFGIRGFKDQVEVMERTCRWAAENGYRTIIKLHPKEDGGITPLGTPYNRLTYRKIATNKALTDLVEHGHLLIDADNRYDTYRLIQEAAACVTVTSQAGLEAAMLGKPVLLCGRAYFGGLGFTREADGPSQLLATLPELLGPDGQETRQNVAKKFFTVFMKKYTKPTNADAISGLLP